MSEVATLQPVERSALMDITPQNLTEAKELATLMSESQLVPKDYIKAPHNILVAMMMGSEVGLKPMQALQNIAVINGRPSVWGDAALAIVRSHPLCEYVNEKVNGQGDSMIATCEVKRRGQPATVQTFSVQDAIGAGLWGKQGPWKQYPRRMLQMRARGFAIRDAFPDALRGMYIAEEAADIPEREVSGEHTFQSEQTASAEDQLKAALRGDSSVPETDAEVAEPVEAETADSSPAEEAGSAIFAALMEELIAAGSKDEVRAVMAKQREAELTQEERAYLAEQSNNKIEEMKN